jgi:CheY-like chemotaxis protein
MDGYEATRLIKEFNPSLTIVALTAYSLESDKEKALSCGCSDVIVKPINRENLYRRLDEYMSNRAN